MRKLIFASVLLLFSSGFATSYAHNISSLGGAFFESVQNTSLVRGYEYYFFNGISLVELNGIPQDAVTSNIYVKNVDNNIFELKFLSIVEGSEVSGYYTTIQCSDHSCDGWVGITSNILTNSGLQVSVQNGGFVLEKSVEDCGDDVCESVIQENCGTCLADCSCSQGYVCSSNVCIVDVSQFCGDGYCDVGINENCATCSVDCSCNGCCLNGECLTNITCGDSVCISGCEYYTNCPFDCLEEIDVIASSENLFCGDGVCASNESYDTCPNDCSKSEQFIHSNAYNHKCQKFFLENESDVTVKAVFKKVRDINKRHFMISLDCSNSLNKNLYSASCLSDICEKGIYCSFGFGRGGEYYYNFKNVSVGNHIVCVWPSAPSNFYWTSELSIIPIIPLFCGDGYCDKFVNESCNSCVNDCGICIKEVLKTKAFEFGKTFTWIDLNEQVSSFNIFVPKNTVVKHAFISVSAKNGDTFFSRKVFTSINNYQTVTSPYIKPLEEISRITVLNSSMFKNGSNNVINYLTTLNKYSSNSWLQGYLKIYYEGAQPYLDNKFVELGFLNSSVIELNIFNDLISCSGNYSFAQIFVPENTLIHDAELITDISNVELVPHKMLFIVNNKKSERIIWQGGSKVFVRDVSNNFKDGNNSFIILFESDCVTINSSFNSFLRFNYSGNSPYISDFKFVSLSGDKNLRPVELFDFDEVVLKNEYSKESALWKVSLISEKLKGLKSKIILLKNKSSSIKKYYSIYNISKKNFWEGVSLSLSFVFSEIEEIELYASELNSRNIFNRNLLEIKRRVVWLINLCDDIFNQVFVEVSS
ncbi:MAG: hypothetical protein GON13_00890 [Nanoarchaeota archaeon]|nr:hypothetical protein [Nanoarchaeota archaeon]